MTSALARTCVLLSGSSQSPLICDQPGAPCGLSNPAQRSAVTTGQSGPRWRIMGDKARKEKVETRKVCQNMSKVSEDEGVQPATTVNGGVTSAHELTSFSKMSLLSAGSGCV